MTQNKKKQLFVLALLILFIAWGLDKITRQSPAPEIIPPGKIILGGHRDPAPGPRFFYPTSLICQTWESLVGIEKTLFAPGPELAESWKMSPDGHQWVFKLRKGVFFQDGHPFDADAVLANFKRYAKSPGKTRFYRFRMNRFYPGFLSIKKRDAHTVVLNFDHPAPTLPYYMAGWGSPMFSPSCFDSQTGEFTGPPSGTGPFKVDHHVPDQYVMLNRSETYWGKPALAPKILIKVIPDVHTRYSALVTGEIMGTIDLGGITPGLARVFEKKPGFDISLAKNSILHLLALNGERFPFNDLRMKQAVNMVIDKKMISRELFYGYFPPAAGILSHASAFYTPQKFSFDPEKAKILAQKVTRGKIVLADLILPSKLFNYPYKEIAQYLQATLATLGIQLTIRQVESGGFNDLILAGDFHMYLRRQGLPHGDAMGIFEDYMRLEGAQGMNLFTQNKRFHYNYNNPEAVALLDKAAVTLDLEKRRTLYARLQELSATTLPVIPLVHETSIGVCNTDLKGYKAIVYGGTLATAHRQTP